MLEGGYVPLLLATCVYAIMVIWHRGSVAVMQAFKERLIPIDQFMASVAARKIPAWEEKLFATMERNAVHVTGFFKLPVDRVVEIGRHVAI